MDNIIYNYEYNDSMHIQIVKGNRKLGKLTNGCYVDVKEYEDFVLANEFSGNDMW